MGHTYVEMQNREHSNQYRNRYVPLIEHICGPQTAAQIYHRIIHKENVLYDWLKENPNANKNEIRKKSHEIAGTLDEYEVTANKQFYVIQAYQDAVEQQSGGACSFSEEMILSTHLMNSALEIANEMQEYADSKNVNIFERIHIFEEILQRYGISWKDNQMSTADMSQMDAAGVIALIVCTTWTNRLRPGLIQLYLKNGTISKWLYRLEALDK